MSSQEEPLVHADTAPEADPAPAQPCSEPPQLKHTVHWFRKGLRLHDNPALREGLEGATTFRCVFIIDPWFASSSNVGINKWRFLLNCLEDLDEGLKKLKSRLFVVRGQPADVLPKLFREWGTTVLSFEEDPEPYGRIRDFNISAHCREVGIKVVTRISHTLYTLDKIIEKNGGKAPLTYHQFQALLANMPPPLQAEEALTVKTLNGTTTPIADDHDDRFGVPTLEELGFDTEGLKPAVWMGGETEALSRLKKHLEKKTWLASLGRSKVPNSLMANPTGLSPYLRFGCLSTRLYYYQLIDVYIKVKKSPPPNALHGQLLLREFFYCAATRNPNFDRMEGNPICVQIPWLKDPIALAKWANGQTGFPWIDAIMNQLHEEGWIHPLARHAVACFLTRGDLWISWEEGMKVFDELLLDTDWSVNAGMWMWWSCSSFFQQFFHCYCPVGFGRKADPNGEYIRRYVPVLRHMPTRYIHEPWAAPEAVQRAARCIVGTNYPVPMVDHAHSAPINIARIKQVYEQLANYIPQGKVDNHKVRDSITNWSESNEKAISQTENKTSHEAHCTKSIPLKQVIIVSQEITVRNSERITYTNALGNDLIVHTTQTTNTTVDTPQTTPQNKKAHYDFKNLAITSKALEYANKFFKTQTNNQHHYSPPPKKTFYKDQKYKAPNFLENCLNMLNPNEVHSNGPTSENKNQDTNSEKSINKDFNGSEDDYTKEDQKMLEDNKE